MTTSSSIRVKPDERFDVGQARSLESSCPGRNVGWEAYATRTVLSTAKMPKNWEHDWRFLGEYMAGIRFKWVNFNERSITQRGYFSRDSNEICMSLWVFSDG